MHDSFDARLKARIMPSTFSASDGMDSKKEKIVAWQRSPKLLSPPEWNDIL